MADERSYYEILGITPDASSEEIARAHARKRREYANNEEMTLLVTRAYEELRNPQNRENNDIDSKYGQRINELDEELAKAESQEEYIKVISKLKKVHLELLSEYSSSKLALSRLFRFERILGNDLEAEKYLLRLEQLISSGENEKEKLDIICFLGNGYKEIGKTEAAIKMYKQIYEVDADRVEEIISLCRLLCEGPKNSKAAIQILNLCTNKAKRAESKAAYLCETIRIVDGYGEHSYDKVRQTLSKLLKGLISKAENPGLVAKSVFAAMGEALEEKKIALFKIFHEVFLSYNVEVPEIKHAVVAMEQMAEVIEDGKMHEFVGLYFTEGWTDADRTKMSRLLLKDIDAIQACINYIKNNAPTYCDQEEEKFKDLQEFVNEVYSQVKEYQRIKINTNISLELREMIRILIVDGLVRFETMQKEFESDRDKFFGRQNKETIQNELIALERIYPACYKLFSDLFFDGKTVDEVYAGNKRETDELSTIATNEEYTNSLPYYPDAKEDYVHSPYISGCGEVVAIVIATCCFPPALPIIFIIKYYNRHAKAINRLLKIVLVIGIIALIGYLVWFANDRKEKQYEEAHDGWLTKEEAQKSDELAAEYFEKTNIDIMYVAGMASTEPDYEGGYIYLSHYGYTDDLESNCMSDNEQEQLLELLSAMIKYEGLSDMEICERFYEITYDFMLENGITYERYIYERNQPEYYQITRKGVYSVGYDTGCIKPGEYSVYVESTGNLTIEMQIYKEDPKYGKYYWHNSPKMEIELTGKKQNITLIENDTVCVNYYIRSYSGGQFDFVIYLDGENQ